MKKEPSAATFAPAQALSGITTLDELELFVIDHVITTAGKWPTKKYTPPDDSLLIGNERWKDSTNKEHHAKGQRSMSYEEAAEYFRKRNPGLSQFLLRAYVRECRLIRKDPKQLAMKKLERAGREVKRERAEGEAWCDAAHKEHDIRMNDLPDTKRGKKQLKDNRKNAPMGGKASAVHDDATLIDAFKRHKSASQIQGITAAVNEITDHLGYANPSALWKRVRSIAAPRKPKDWFKTLLSTPMVR